MMKRLGAALALAFAVLLAVPNLASANEIKSPDVAVNATGSVTITFPAGSFAAGTEVSFAAVSGDSAPIEANHNAYSALTDSLGGLAVSVRQDDASASPEQLTFSGVLTDGEAVQGVVAIESTDMHNGFTAFLAQPTIVGMSMGALLWIAIAVTALTVGLIALGRSRRTPGTVRTSPVVN